MKNLISFLVGGMTGAAIFTSAPLWVYVFLAVLWGSWLYILNRWGKLESEIEKFDD